KLLLDLGQVFEGWAEPLAVGIGFDGAVYAAARSSAEPPTDYQVVRLHAGERRTLVVRAESILVSFVQPYPGGLLLAGARCHWTPGSPERNAVAIDWEGREL